MKIIRIIKEGDVPEVDFHPDSAMILPGRPLFMPDYGENRRVRLYLAVKISRLGKNVGRKFVTRYYDSFTLGQHIVCDTTAATEGLLSGADSTLNFDGWQASAGLDGKISISIARDGRHAATHEEAGPDLRERIERAVCAVSRYATLKMGDVIMLPLDGLEEIALEGACTLDFCVNGKQSALRVL